MYGDMKSYKLLAVTIFLSLLLHILIIYFVKFTNERQNAENHPKGEPVEIEVMKEPPAVEKFIKKIFCHQKQKINKKTVH